MSSKVVTMRDDDHTIIEKVVDLAVEATGRLREDERRHYCDAIRAVVSDKRITTRLEDGANDLTTSFVDLATRLGFFLALTVASHGPLGDRAWLAEALRLAGEDVTVEVRQPDA